MAKAITAQHTPGPWVAEPVGISSNRNTRIRCDHPTHPHIADAAGRPSKAHPGDWDYADAVAEQEANARLIAAAPTMHSYIQKRAEDGDAEAVSILEAIDAGR